ncbi:hypothetical protein LB505_013288 [Fusarium chuoi]|nr:hypothetical protein LB505_013288 [Fusarium chuoi]
MKFSIASTLLLANGIAAMPWSSLSAKQSNGEEITETLTTLAGLAARRLVMMISKYHTSQRPRDRGYQYSIKARRILSQHSINGHSLQYIIA